MAVKTVLRMGNPLLYKVSARVSHFDTKELYDTIQDMWDTMLACQGAGIAAPQIGADQQIVIFGVETPRYASAEEVPETVLINPEITLLDETTEEAWEGCLSVPGFRGLVARPRRIFYKGYDPKGNVIEREATGFHARVVQHEVDHVNGILFPMRIKNMMHFSCEEEVGFNQLIDQTDKS